MNVIGIAWAGVRTDRFTETRRFIESVLGMTVILDLPDFAVFRRPSGDRVEVFGPDAAVGAGAVQPEPGCGGASARRELGAAGIELLGDLVRHSNGSAWQHFRGPDGNTWELSFDPNHPSISSAI